jgi:UDP-N-acetyl-D-mannosaminuronic acid dehydrogenase
MAVNEGLPAYLVGRAEARWPLAECTVGILGMSFKAESDDVRSSLAQELRRLLEVRAARVLCTDPYVTVDPTLVPMEVVLAEADVYRMEDLAERDVVDVWNLLARGVLT